MSFWDLEVTLSNDSKELGKTQRKCKKHGSEQ